MALIGKTHIQLLDWCRNIWLQDGPPVCFLEGFPGVGKSNLTNLLMSGLSIPAIKVFIPESEGDYADDLLLNLEQELSAAGIEDFASARSSGRELLSALEQLLQRPILVVIDEFQNAMIGEEARLTGKLATVFQRVVNRPQAKGRVLLLTNRIVERAKWSEPFAIKTLKGMDDADGERLLDQFLNDFNVQHQLPASVRKGLVYRLGGNPRALRLLATSLQTHTLEDLVNINPDTWEYEDRIVSPELIAKFEREILHRILGQLQPDYRAALFQLAVFRKPFRHKAIEAIFGKEKKEYTAHFKAELVNQFLMEPFSSIGFTLHPIVREIGLQKLHDEPNALRQAHIAAAQHFARHFHGQTLTDKLATLGGYFVEARYHLVQAGQTEKMTEIARPFFAHIRTTITGTSPVPSDPQTRDERIAMLAAVLDQPGPSGLEYHLARLYQSRNVKDDLSKAAVHIRRALTPTAPSDIWVLAGKILAQNGQLEAAIRLMRDGIQKIPADKNLFTLYKVCADLLTQNGQREEAISLLLEGIQKIPADKSLFTLYQICADLLTQAGQREEAISLLQEGIQKIPVDKSVVSLYQICADVLTQNGQPEEAISLLREGIQRIPADKNLFSLYQLCADLLTQNGQRKEAISLLQEGMEKIPADKSLSSLYRICAELMTQAGQREEAISLLREGMQKIPADKNLFSLYQIYAELMSQSGQRKEALRVLQAGVKIIPGEFGGYSLFYGLASYLAADGDYEGLQQLLAQQKNLNERNHAIVKCFLYQLDNEWGQAALAVGKYGDRVALLETKCWLGAGDAVKALEVIQHYLQVVYGRGEFSAWLMAVVQHRLGNMAAARQYLSEYLGEVWTGSEAAIGPTLLRLWDEPSHTSERKDLAYQFPILPPALSGLAYPVRRGVYGPSVLPEAIKTVAVSPETHSSNPPGKLVNKIFISYAHEDEEWLQKVKLHLASLQHFNIELTVWDDSRIPTGDKWKQAIDQALAETKVGILLITPAFMASSFIKKEEVPVLLKKVETAGGRIIPVLIEETIFTMHPILKHFQSLNPPEKLLANLTVAEQNTYFVKMLKDIVALFGFSGD